MRIKEVKCGKDFEVNKGFVVQKKVVPILPIWKDELMFSNENDADDYIVIHGR